MLEWTQARGGSRLMLLAHHDDAARECRYRTESEVSMFSDELRTQAEHNGWTIVSMKDGRKRVLRFKPTSRRVKERSGRLDRSADRKGMCMETMC